MSKINNKHESIVRATRHWLEKTVIDFNFCPFASPVFKEDLIDYQIIETKTLEDQLRSFAEALQRLAVQPETETSLIIFNEALEDFQDYLELLELANQLLVDLGYEGQFQLASFHPDYCFADVEPDDPSHYTNRSPYPMLHILREASIEKALANYPNPELIPERNIKKAREQGVEVFKAILEQSILDKK